MDKRSSKESKVIILTGASSGIGAAVALLLARKGYSLTLAARRKKELGAVARSLAKKNVLICPTDVRDGGQVKRLVLNTYARFGRIDALINCAGVLIGGPLEASSEEEIRSTLEINLLGTILSCKFVLPVFKRQKSGHIINISSVAGTRAQPHMAVYSASKFGVMGFSDALALELKGTGVKVSTIRPGTVVTDLWKESWTPEVKKEAHDLYLKPEDVAETVLFVLRQPPRSVIRDVFIHPRS